MKEMDKRRKERQEKKVHEEKKQYSNEADKIVEITDEEADKIQKEIDDVSLN